MIKKVFLLFLFFISPCYESQNEDMVLIKGTMKVESFYLDKYEVTMSDFDQFQKATDYVSTCEKMDSAVVFKPYYQWQKGVSWKHDLKGNLIEDSKYKVLPVSRITLADAQAFCKWRGKRLPKKREWLLAARGENTFKYPGGNRAKVVGWFDSNSREMKRPVGKKAPNDFGLFDMGGNMAELVLIDSSEWIEFLGGSFFDDKDFFENKYLQNGWQISPNSQLTSHSPTWGCRCAKDYNE